MAFLHASLCCSSRSERLIPVLLTSAGLKRPVSAYWGKALRRGAQALAEPCAALRRRRDQGAASAGSLGEALPGDSMGDVLGAQGATASRLPGISTRMSVAGCADSFRLPISCGTALHLEGQTRRSMAKITILS